MYQHISEILEDSKSSLHQNCLPTGNATVDKLLGGGIGTGELINFVAGVVTDCDKLMLSLATDMAVEYNVPTAVIDIDRGPNYLANLICGHVENLSNNDFWSYTSNGKIIVSTITKEKVGTSPIYLSGDYEMSLNSIINTIKELKAQKDVKTFFITSPLDALCLSHDEITLSMKKLCRELGISILYRSIPNYALDFDSPYKYSPSFRECVDEGMNQEYSDVIISISRPEILGITSDTEGVSLEDALIAKVFRSPRSGLITKYIRMGKNVLGFK